MAKWLPIKHYLLPLVIFWLARWDNRFLWTLFNHALRPKMLFFKTLNYTWPLSSRHIVKTLVFWIFLGLAFNNFKWVIFDIFKRFILTLVNLYFWEVHIWSHFFTLLNSLNLFIICNFCVLRADSVNTLLNFFFVRIDVNYVLFRMVNSKLSHVSHHLIII